MFILIICTYWDIAVILVTMIYRKDETMKQEKRLTVSALDRKYRFAIDGMRKNEADAAFYLAEMERRKPWRKLGFSSTIHYATVAGGIGEGKAWHLLKLGRDLERYPRLRQAFADGEISWTKLREVLRLKEKGDEVGLLELALSRTNRELEEYVTERNRSFREKVMASRTAVLKELNNAGIERPVSLAVDACRKANPDSEAGSDGKRNQDGTELPKSQSPAVDGFITVTLRFTPEQHAVFTSACALRRKSVQGNPSREEIVSEMMLESLDKCSEKVSNSTTWRKSKEVQLIDSPYVMVLYHCQECGKNSAVSESGKEVDVGKATMEQASCDCSYYEASGKGMPGRKKRVVSPAVRRKVLLRDHGRCRTPGCSNTRYLQVHHLRPVSAGGSNDPVNLITVCGLCHSNIHKGRLNIKGEHPSIEFFHRDGRGKEIPFGERVCQR